MKLLLTTIAALLVVGCGESQQSATSPEAKPVEPVVEAAKPEPPTVKAPDIDIHTAAARGNIEAVKYHLAAGTDVNAKDEEGETPLHLAAGGGRKEVIELLIEKGADLNAQGVGGMTPLDWAYGETAYLLSKHGGKSGF
jgi:ankyrin repeat protein